MALTVIERWEAYQRFLDQCRILRVVEAHIKRLDASARERDMQTRTNDRPS